MENLPVFFVPGVFILVFIVFAMMIIGSRRLAPEETGLVPQFKVLGGGWIGPWKATFPFVQVRAYDAFLAIGVGTNKPIVLSFADIESVTYQSYVPGLLMKGFTITHHRVEAPKRIVLYVTSEPLKDLLRTKTAYLEA